MMVDSQFPLKADVLRIGHHGSYTSTTREFVEAVNPRYAVISCGKGNEYGHPHQVVLNRLAGTDVFRTDLQGTILCVSDGTNIRFSLEKETQENLYAAPATAAPESTGV